jgi:hypothetical protein
VLRNTLTWRHNQLGHLSYFSSHHTTDTFLGALMDAGIVFIFVYQGEKIFLVLCGVG